MLPALIYVEEDRTSRGRPFGGGRGGLAARRKERREGERWIEEQVERKGIVESEAT